MNADQALEKVRTAESEWREADAARDTAQERRFASWRAAHKAGASYAQIAAVVGVTRAYIAEMVKS